MNLAVPTVEHDTVDNSTHYYNDGDGEAYNALLAVGDGVIATGLLAIGLAVGVIVAASCSFSPFVHPSVSVEPLIHQLADQ